VDHDLERRHLQQMQLSLGSYPASVSSLGRMVAELEALYALLGGRDDTWKKRFYEQWASLEEVFAVALDRKTETLDEEGDRIVCAAISELRVIVDEAL
jgi:hypothetical protein